MFDPSQMDPKVLMELSQLIQQLPPEKLNRMQTLMHNMMAGHDVRQDMEEFERGLPAGFREKLLGMMSRNPTAFAGAEAAMGMSPFGMAPNAASMAPISVSSSTSEQAADIPGNLHEARLTILRAVADGRMTPEEAEQLLFSV